MAISAFLRPSLFTSLLAGALLITPLTGCGGGGGGDEFVGAALVALQVSPRKIDTGDRVQVRAMLERVNKDGVVLKFRYPTRLVYVPGTSMLMVDGDEIDITPMVNTNDGNRTYLVYFLSEDWFEEGRGDVVFQLTAVDDTKSAPIEVDADVNDTSLPDPVEFSIDNPQFEAEDTVEIEIRG